MKQLYITLLLALCSFAPQASAQETSGPGWLMGDSLMQRINERFHGSELQKKLLNKRYSQYMAAVRAQQWAEAYPAYKEVVVTCPNLTEHIYMHASSVIFPQLLAQERDENMKKLFLADWLDVYDKRIKYIDTFLKDNPTPQKANSKGDLMVWKAYNNLIHGSTAISDFDSVQARALFAEAFEEVEQHGGRDIEDYNIANFWILSRDVYMRDPSRYLEQFMSDYFSMSEVCDNVLNVSCKQLEAEGKVAESQEKADKFTALLGGMENEFNNSGALNDTTKLVMTFGSRIEENKNNQLYLDRSIRALSRVKGCDSLSVYLTAVKYSWALGPSDQNILAMAGLEMKHGNTDAALKLFNDALARTEDKVLKANIAKRIGFTLVQLGDYETSERYYDMAGQLDPESEGQVRYLLAENYRKQAHELNNEYRQKYRDVQLPPNKKWDENDWQVLLAAANTCASMAEAGNRVLRMCDKANESYTIASFDSKYKDQANKGKERVETERTATVKIQSYFSKNQPTYRKLYEKWYAEYRFVNGLD